MKLIFLDVDGVLNNRRSMAANPGTIHNVHRPCVALLNEICEKTGAYCVLSSTWRHSWPVAAFQMFLEDHGFTGRVIDRTCHLPGQDRGVEISAYLAECTKREYPVESWVILDDDSDMGPLLPYLVRTITRVGLEFGHVEAAVKVLND